MKRLLFIGLLIPTLLLAQEKGPQARGARTESIEVFTGKTHAVIIGISLYDTIPSLNFAHRDAEAFSQFLHSSYYSGGPVNDTLLINSKAKKLDIIKQIKGLYHRVEEGDRIVIFFAGHGDREVESGGSYLLAYDTYLNNYSATAVSIDWLKRSITTLITDKKVAVWLIADACRSGDFKLAGDFIRGRYRVWESWQPVPGELNMLSCQSKELSYEAEKWDNGHGVFSYFLLKGLNGGADSIGNNDSQVRAFELDAYLKLRVPAASPLIQIPIMNTSDWQAIVATIPPELVQVKNQSLKETARQSILRASTEVQNIPRPSSYLPQTPTLKPSQKQKNNYNRILQNDSIPSKSKVKADTTAQNQKLNKEALYFELMAKVQPILLAYLSEGANATSAETYAVTSNYLTEAEKLLLPSDPDYMSTCALKYFFLGVNLNKTNRLSSAIAQLDSAVALDTLKAFIYYERGTSYLRLGLKDRADRDFSKAMQLSPTWSLLRSKKDDNEKMLAMSTSAKKNSGQRKALVIGNKNYRYTNLLKNSANDANDMANALKKLGFSVLTYIDTDYRLTTSAVNRFTQTLLPNDTAIFYYSGHGISDNNQNYILPVDTPVSYNEKGVSIDYILNNLEHSRVGTSLVLLDACRTNLSSENRSKNSLINPIFSSLASIPSSSMVVWATETGGTFDSQSDRNGVFTSELLKYLTRPGLSIREIIGRTKEGVSMRTAGVQTLTQYDELQGDFVLFPQNEKKLRDNSSIDAFFKSADSDLKPSNSDRRTSASSRGLDEENGSLKELGTVNSNGIKIKITRVKGNTENKEVTVTCVMTNAKANIEVTYGDVYAIDNEGDQYENNRDNSFLNTLYTDVPRVIAFTLKQIPSRLQRFSYFRFRLKTTTGSDWQEIVFREVPIDWK